MTGFTGNLSRILLLAASFISAPPAFARPAMVDVALLLAVDASASIDYNEFDLQIRGIAAAFENPALTAAIAGGPNRRIAVALLQWSGHNEQKLVIGWRIIASAAEARALAGDIRSTPRFFRGGTSITAMLRAAEKAFVALPYKASRRIIDISGDGSNTDPQPPRNARRQLLSAGITINALTILDEEPGLERFFAETVIGGPDSFTLPVGSFADFSTAIRAKLLREIGAPQRLSRLRSVRCAIN